MRREVSSNIYDMAIPYVTSSKNICGNPVRGHYGSLKLSRSVPHTCPGAHRSKRTISQCSFDKVFIWNFTDGTRLLE